MRGQCFFTFEDIISSRRGIILLLLLTLAAFRHNMGYNQITFSQFPFVFLHHIIQMAFLLIHLHLRISERHFGFRPFSHCLSSSKFIYVAVFPFMRNGRGCYLPLQKGRQEDKFHSIACERCDK